MITPFLPSPSDAEAACTQLEQLWAQAGQVSTRLTEVLEDLPG